MSSVAYARPSVGGYGGRSNVIETLTALLMAALTGLLELLPTSMRFTARAGFSYGYEQGERILAGQGITGETKAILSFFALIVIGTFVLGSIDTNLPTSGLDANYTDASSQASGGYLDFVNIGIVLPVVVVGGLMLAVISRVL